MATYTMQLGSLNRLETLNELQAQVVEGLIRPRAAYVAHKPAFQLRFVFRWAGRLLLTLSGCALVAALSWQTPHFVLLACAYGGAGLMSLLTSRIGAR